VVVDAEPLAQALRDRSVHTEQQADRPHFSLEPKITPRAA
jgi:hypothetical protein